MSKRLFAVLILVATIFAATPTLATTLTITYFNCEQASSSTTQGRLYCEVWASGGTGSYTYTWTKKIGTNQPTSWTNTSNYIETSCTIGGPAVYMSVTVTDSAGATAASGTDTVFCTQYIP